MKSQDTSSATRYGAPGEPQGSEAGPKSIGEPGAAGGEGAQKTMTAAALIALLRSVDPQAEVSLTIWDSSDEGAGYGYAYEVKTLVSRCRDVEREIVSIECEARLSSGGADAGSFGWAIGVLKCSPGAMVARRGWDGMWITLVRPMQHVGWASGWGYVLYEGFERVSDMPMPWIGMRTADGGFVPWLASQADMLAEDWIEVGV